MSGVPHDSINVRDAGIAYLGNDQNPPQSASNQASHRMSNFVDGSGPILSMYLERAEEEDKKMAENWKADADGILIFSGLFSATVATLASVSLQDLRPNPQDTSNFYLANIYQILADPNRSNLSSALIASPPPFSPSNSAFVVNTLWFSSLAICIACALLATLLQQWARRYLVVTQPRYSPHKRARIRTFFFEGAEKFLLPWVVEALPTLLHFSLFLFSVGIIVFVSGFNLSGFRVALSFVSVGTVAYGCLTLLPIVRRDSPYRTPLSLPAWHIVTGVPFVTFRVLQWFTCFPCFSHRAWNHFRHLEKSYRKLLAQGMQKAAEETALNSPSESDARIFLRTLDSLDEDHELERFFYGLPGFRSSKVVADPLPGLTEEEKEKLSEALIGFLDHTFSSDLFSEPVKNRRAIICAKAVDPAQTPEAFGVFDKILSKYQYSGPLGTGIVQIVRGWGNNRGKDATLNAQATISMVVARVQPRDDSWFILASDELGVPEFVLRGYAAKGNNLSLAILIHIIRQQFNHFLESSWPSVEFSFILEAASKFNVRDTSPELQHEFCALWNAIVLRAQSGEHERIVSLILRPIHNVYIALHRDTPVTRFSPSYPLCNVPGHHPYSIPRIHSAFAPTTAAHPVLHNNVALGPAALASMPTPHRVNESLTDVPLLDHDIYAPGSFHPAHQTPIENLRIAATSQDPVTACVIQGDIDTPTTTISLSIPEPSAAAPPTSIAFTSPPGAVAVRHIIDYRTSSDVLAVPSLPSPTPVPDNILPTESHSSLLAPPAPSPSRAQVSFAPYLSAAAERGGSTNTALPKERDTRTTIQENTMAALDLPPQSLSPSSVTDIAITGPSWRSLSAEHTGDRPPHLSHGQ